MSAVVIRDFALEDSHDVATLIRDNLLKVNSKDYPEPIIHNMCNLFSAEYIGRMAGTRRMVVAVEQGQIIGTASLDRDTIYTVFVEVRHHGKGVGRSLIHYLERAALTAGACNLQVPSSLTAERFYFKLGYRPVRSTESKQFGTDIIMVKDLQSFVFREHTPTGEEWIRLVESAGWQGITGKGAASLEEALNRSWYMLSAFNGDDLIGAGRIISDGILQAVICDLIILPDYQGKGVGTGILRRLLKRCQEQEIPMVQLFAAPHKADFYKRFGFEERLKEAPGMRWVDRHGV